MTTDREWDQHRKRIENARGPFEQISPYLYLLRYGGNYGTKSAPIAARVQAARRALDAWRNANNQRHNPDDIENLIIRISADQFAADIQGAAGPEHDPSTIAWVLAGLRCPAQPFCTGCPSCFTVTAPARHDVKVVADA
jgi:hypothetical protein